MMCSRQSWSSVRRRNAFLGCPFFDGEVDGHHFAQLLVQLGRAPLLRIGVGRNVRFYGCVDHLMAHVLDGAGHIFTLHDVDALLEDDLALVVHHVVELEDVLAGVEVARLDLLLGLFQCLVDPRMDNGLAFFRPSFCSMLSMRSEPKMRIRSSSSDR
jgi:uncharacterized protein YunC (DUF1805 family)